MKILNLYACLGGNRYKWNEVAKEAGIEIEVTAVELDPELARMYQERFPNDTVIVADAHQYLLDHYKEFDFIWSSPPCPTHSRARYWGSKGGQCNVMYPDMKLWQEIILLDFYFDTRKWVVENVVPYYDHFIPPTKELGKHVFWSNFKIPNFQTVSAHYEKQKEIESFHQIDLSDYKGDQSKKKIARNLVHFDTGRTIFETVLGIYKANNANQTTIFDEL